MNNLINNEALALLSLHSIISQGQETSIENLYLAIPLVFDKKVRSYLKKRNTRIISAQHLVTTKSELFVGFNEKFKDTLITTTNALTMGLEMGVFKITNQNIFIQHPFETPPSSAGKKLDEIIKSSAKIASILREHPSKLYSLLRIEL